MKTKLHRLITARVATFIAALGLQLALAQTPDPAAFVATDQPGYQPGGIVMITGGGFQAGETVSLQVLRTDGTNCLSPQHGSWTVVADETGAIQADWFLCPEDPPSTTLQLTATGQTSARAAAAAFVNSAAIAAYVNTDQVDYAPGSTVYINGGGFNAGENVSVQVVHGDSTGTNDPVHQPWTVLADANGAFQTAWEVGNDHLGASLQVLAFRGASDPAAQTAFTDSDGDACPLFISALVYAAGGSPWSVAVGDFNGDAQPDLAVGGGNSANNVSVLLNNGSGGFLAAVNYAAGIQPRSVAVGDFNGDGKPDLAVANSGSANVSVLLGNGNGGFLATAIYAAGVVSFLRGGGRFQRRRQTRPGRGEL